MRKNSDVIISYKSTGPDTDDDEEDESQQRVPLYSCCAPHCKEVFRSIHECEQHYMDNHIFECKECNFVFPNEFLLDLVSS